MTTAVIPITLPFMLNVSVNCYLVRTEGGCFLVDTGRAGQRRRIQAALAGAGCTPETLKLIVLTHGDFDHCGNAACLSRQFDAPVAMHAADVGMVERGDMFWNRRQPSPVMGRLLRALMRLSPADRFSPDVLLKPGDDLAAYGWEATVVALPGHSQGSIGLLTTMGSFFCGDLLANVGKPDVWSILDDRAAAAASVAALADLPITTVYPGHGRPFPIEQFWAGRAD